MFYSVAKLMNTFRSGKLSRPFQIIPNTENWL